MMEPNKVDPLSSPYVEANNNYQGDEGVDESEYMFKPRGHVLQQQWVTLTASMYPEPTSSSTITRGWKIAPERLPILAAVFCGAALVVCILAAFLLYRCCIMPRREKHYCIRKTETSANDGRTSLPTLQQNYPTNQAIVFAEQKNYGFGYSNRLAPNPWYNNRVAGPQCTQCPGLCPVPRSNSNPGTSAQCRVESKRQRPLSQPVQLIGPSIITNGEIVPKSGLPEISEFSPQQGGQYASSSILDEACSRERDDNSDGPTLKTRSLPAWVRSKPRPLSTEDDLNDLYAKVNFSKKRKNRMRNDEAAIIALSKSRSQFLHKDTDCLVDNEAVIVYDERTAL